MTNTTNKVDVLLRLPDRMNHTPEDIGKWIKYTGYRYKDPYNIQLKDGTIHKNMYPNSYYWNQGFNNVNDLPRAIEIEEPIHDDQVVAIQLMEEDDPYFPKYRATGKERIDRNYRMFGVPVDVDGNLLDLEFDIRLHNVVPYNRTKDKTTSSK